MGVSSWLGGSTATAPPRLSRKEREECWKHRDNFFGCLDAKGISVPHGPDHKAKGGCEKEDGEYQKACAASWVDYFNKRRVLQLRQDLMEKKAAEQLAAPGGPIGGRL
ncbi:cytochrome c oxidase assembly factor 6, partial [Phenoliferia sp. Uapishka_3]